MQVIERFAWLVFFVTCVLMFGVALYAFAVGIILHRRSSAREEEEVCTAAASTTTTIIGVCKWCGNSYRHEVRK